MSEVAGRMAVQQGAKYLEMAQGGHGVLLGRVPGVDPGTVLIIGGGVVGINAAKMACGLGAIVYILDMNLDRLRYFATSCLKIASRSCPARRTIRDLVKKADVVIGAVLIPGNKAPHNDYPGNAQNHETGVGAGGCGHRPGWVLRNIQSRPPTTIRLYIVDACDSLLCGQHARRRGAQTSTLALTNATLPYAVEIANKGWQSAMRENAEIKRGANVVNGRVTYEGVAKAFGLEHVPIDKLL